MNTHAPSSNETEQRTINAINACRFGYDHTADFILPRLHYYTLSSSDAYMALQLLVIDQSRVLCESLVHNMMQQPRLFRGTLKHALSRLHRKGVTNGTSTICSEINSAIMRNLTDDEITSFALMASIVDETINPHLVRLRTAIHTEIGRCKVPYQNEMTEVVSVCIFLTLAKEIISKCRSIQRGSRYLLCYNPMESESRSRAYDITTRDVDRLLSACQQVVRILASSHTFKVPYTDAIQNGIQILTDRMTDILTVFNAAIEGGLSLGRKSVDSLRAELAETERKRKSRLQPTQPPRAKFGERTIQPTDLASLFQQKGWQVTKQ